MFFVISALISYWLAGHPLDPGRLGPFMLVLFLISSITDAYGLLLGSIFKPKVTISLIWKTIHCANYKIFISPSFFLKWNFFSKDSDSGQTRDAFQANVKCWGIFCLSFTHSYARMDGASKSARPCGERRARELKGAGRRLSN